jgi:hypothetical protein
MKQNVQFEEILNRCLDRVLKGEPVEQCLRDYPGQAKELEPLLRTALAARAASAVLPSSEFKARARYEFQAALQDMKSTRKRANPFLQWRWQWQSAWSLAALVLAFILLSGSGTVIAARNSMPDNPLYSVKLFTENVQLTFTRSDTGKTELNARFAERRADEIVYAASNNKTQDVQTAASHLNSNMANIADLTGNTLAAANLNNAQKSRNDTVATGQEMQSQSLNAAPPVVNNTAGNAPVVLSTPGPESIAPPEISITAAPQTAPAPVTGGNAGSGVTPEPAPQPASVPSVMPMAPAVKGFAPEQPAQTNEDTQKSADTPISESPQLRHSYGLNGANNSGNPATEQEKLLQVISANYATLKSRLEEALKVASPDVRQIIRQALAQAQDEYDKAVKNLQLAELANQ